MGAKPHAVRPCAGVGDNPCMQQHPDSIRSARARRAPRAAVAALTALTALTSLTALSALSMLIAAPAHAQDKPVYRCPGPPVLYTDALSAPEAKSRGCTTIEGATVTIVPASKARITPAPSAPVARAPGEGRIDPADQRARDSDARRILTDELQREETRLAEIRKEYNNGEPERLGSERNYQRYLDRVGELKSALARKEADVAAIRRELTKLQP